MSRCIFPVIALNLGLMASVAIFASAPAAFAAIPPPDPKSSCANYEYSVEEKSNAGVPPSQIPEVVLGDVQNHLNTSTQLEMGRQVTVCIKGLYNWIYVCVCSLGDRSLQALLPVPLRRRVRSMWISCFNQILRTHRTGRTGQRSSTLLAILPTIQSQSVSPKVPRSSNRAQSQVCRRIRITGTTSQAQSYSCWQLWCFSPQKHRCCATRPEQVRRVHRMPRSVWGSCKWHSGFSSQLPLMFISA